MSKGSWTPRGCWLEPWVALSEGHAIRKWGVRRLDSGKAAGGGGGCLRACTQLLQGLAGRAPTPARLPLLTFSLPRTIRDLCLAAKGATELAGRGGGDVMDS